MTQYTFGNGVTDYRYFDANSGLLTNVRASPDGFSNTADFDYAYDSLGNLIYRAAALVGTFEDFCYDPLNRLVDYNLASGAGVTCTGAGFKSVSYDPLGNITSKSDVGTYKFGDA